MRMVVERGPRLAPATASDAERLDTWRIGSQVNVQFVRLGSRPMERKWWAILGLVVNQCNVPWKTKEQASEAVKLALGIVNLTKTVGGSWMQYPKSLTELDDAELDDAVRDMADLITKMTGIDPETLRKETADVGRDDEEQDQPEIPQSPEPADSGEAPCTPSLAASNSESAAAGPSPEEAGPPLLASSGDDNHKPLHEFATRLIAVIGDETQFVLEEAGRLVKEIGITDAADVDRARSAAKYAARACGDYTKDDKLQKKTAVKFIAGIVGVEEKDLVR